MNPVQRLLRFISHPDHKRTLSILAFLSILAAIPLTVYISQQSQDIRQRAAYEPGETWNIYAQPVCANNTTPTGQGRIGWAFNPLEWQYDGYTQGTHFKSIININTGIVGNLYIRMEPEDQVEWEGFQPIESTIDPSYTEFARAFGKPEIWVAIIHRRYDNRPPQYLPSGQYTIKFKAPERWCNATVPPTPTPTQPPNALPQRLTVKPLIACSDTPISDGSNVLKFIYSQERSHADWRRPAHIAIAIRDAGSQGSLIRDWEYFIRVSADACANFCTLTNEEERSHGNRCCLMQPNQFDKVMPQNGDLTKVIPNPSDKLRLVPDTTYYARLVLTMPGNPFQGTEDVRTTFSIPSCRSLTPTPTPTPTTIPPTPTPTLSPTGTQTAAQFTFSLALTGIGEDGNRSPRTTQRTIQIELFDSRNEPLPIKTGTVTFNSLTNRFGLLDETINMGTLTEGNYIIKVKSPKYLKKRIPGILTIERGKTTPYAITPATLIVGDANNDNKLDILDFNIIYSCFGDRSCDNKDSVDFNDDGKVDGVDYNFFVRSVAVKQGD